MGRIEQPLPCLEALPHLQLRLHVLPGSGHDSRSGGRCGRRRRSCNSCHGRAACLAADAQHQAGQLGQARQRGPKP